MTKALAASQHCPNGTLGRRLLQPQWPHGQPSVDASICQCIRMRLLSTLHGYHKQKVVPPPSC